MIEEVIFYFTEHLLDKTRYRSSVSRFYYGAFSFYYGAFSLLTHELSEAGANFGADQETPNHKGLPKLIRLHRLYSARISADYQRRTTDEAITRSIMRDAAKLFRHFGVNYD